MFIILCKITIVYMEPCIEINNTLKKTTSPLSIIGSMFIHSKVGFPLSLDPYSFEHELKMIEE